VHRHSPRNVGNNDLVVASGSHGGVIAAGMNLTTRPRLIIFNDAGSSAHRTGAASLSNLTNGRVAAAAVIASSVHIGYGKSRLMNGVQCYL
jgi:hypothetical protein